MRRRSGGGSIGRGAVGVEGEDYNKGAITFGFGGSKFHEDCGKIHQSNVRLICPGLSPCPPGLHSLHPCPPVPVSTNDRASLGGDVIVPGIVWGSRGSENVRGGGRQDTEE